jgi:NADH-quinone oxidoreductase subunit K
MNGISLAIPLWWYLFFAAALFCIGLYGVLARKNAILILMGIELMLNAVNVNLVAFWRYVEVGQTGALGGQIFAIMGFAVAAAEVAVGLALFISIYRQRSTIAVDEIDLMKW